MTQDMELKQMRAQIANLKNTIEAMRGENYFLKEVVDYCIRASEYRYGDYFSIKNALLLVKEFQLVDDNIMPSTFLTRVARDFDDGYEENSIDIVYALHLIKKDEVENKLLSKGIDINIEISPNFSATESCLLENDKKILREAMERNIGIFDDLDRGSKNLLEYSGFDIEGVKEEILYEQKQHKKQRR